MTGGFNEDKIVEMKLPETEDCSFKILNENPKKKEIFI